MSPVLRSVSSVLGGLFVGVLVIAAVEALSSRIYPLPAGLDPANAEALRAHIASLPTGAFLFVLVAWGLGSLAGSWMTARLAPSRGQVHGFFVGALLLGASVANMLMLPHPAWFWFAAVAVLAAGTYAGTVLASGRN